MTVAQEGTEYRVPINLRQEGQTIPNLNFTIPNVTNVIPQKQNCLNKAANSPFDVFFGMVVVQYPLRFQRVQAAFEVKSHKPRGIGHSTLK